MGVTKGSYWGRLPISFDKAEPIGPVVNNGVTVTKCAPAVDDPNLFFQPSQFLIFRGGVSMARGLDVDTSCRQVVAKRPAL